VEIKADDSEMNESHGEAVHVAGVHLAIVNGNEGAENDHVDERLHVFAVVHRAKAGNETKDGGEAGIPVVLHGQRRFRWGVWKRLLRSDESGEAGLAIERTANVARALRTHCFPAIAAVTAGLRVGMCGAFHRELLLSVSIKPSGGVSGNSSANILPLRSWVRSRGVFCSDFSCGFAAGGCDGCSGDGAETGEPEDSWSGCRRDWIS